MNLSGLQKVLVADDDGINRTVLAELLKPEHTVLLAKNGAQSLELAFLLADMLNQEATTRAQRAA